MNENHFSARPVLKQPHDLLNKLEAVNNRQLKQPKTGDTCVSKSYNDDAGCFIRAEKSPTKMSEERGEEKSHDDVTSSRLPGTCFM